MLTTSGALAYVKTLVSLTYNSPMGSTCYIGLSTTTPATDGSNFTEPDSENGYARVLISNASQSTQQKMTATSSGNTGTAMNNEIIYFPEATASWGTVTHFGLFTSASASTPILYGALTSSVAIAANYIPLFRTGQLVITIS